MAACDSNRPSSHERDKKQAKPDADPKKVRKSFFSAGEMPQKALGMKFADWQGIIN